jgi:hypothetical protein
MMEVESEFAEKTRKSGRLQASSDISHILW